MKTVIYKGLYNTLLILTNRFNIRLLSRYKILIGIALLVLLSSCHKEKEEKEKEPPVTCYLVGPS